MEKWNVQYSVVILEKWNKTNWKRNKVDISLTNNLFDKVLLLERIFFLLLDKQEKIM